MNQREIRTSLLEYFSRLDDPRIERTKRHKLVDIIAIAVCAVISGAEGFVDIERYGNAKYEWLKGFLELPNGIPSHDTFGRFFSMLDPERFHDCFLEWINAVGQLTKGHVIAIDGKTLRGSYDTASNKSALHMVSAWASANRLVLAQRAVDSKSNEITAIPELLKILDIAGAIVTIDAMGTQREIAKQIHEQEGEYVLALKENHPRLYAQTVALFEQRTTQNPDRTSVEFYQHTDAGHGRVEVRRCWSVNVAERWAVAAEWAGLQSVAMIERERHIGETITVERSYYLTSLPSQAKPIAEAVRTHWGIENSLHWVLDVTFNEDASRIRRNHAIDNFSLLRKIALNLLSQETGSKSSIRGKRKIAGWNNDFLIKILTG